MDVLSSRGADYAGKHKTRQCEKHERVLRNLDLPTVVTVMITEV